MSSQAVITRLLRLYKEVLTHEGYGDIRIEMKMLKKGQKEIIIHCGKQYRYVVDMGDLQPIERCIAFQDRQLSGQAAGG